MRNATMPVYSTFNQCGWRPQEAEVPASVLYMSMSLDGYIAGPNGGLANPGGDRFMRLHEWFSLRTGRFSGRPGRPES
ncbi:MAG: hypothetical protein ACRDOD_06765 [Streptosporangiaceae bacterium]